MAIRDDLLSFVRQALERGIARPEIRAVLLEAGWRAEDVWRRWRRNSRLPRALDDLPPDLGPAAAARDPESGERYEYAPLGDQRYRLCATFDRDSAGEASGARRDFWAHGAGRHCFEIDVKRVRC